MPSVKLATKRYRDVNSPEAIPTRTRPKGWTAAEAVLKRTVPERRERLLALTEASGLQGAPALEFFARLLRWFLDGIDEVPVPAKLKPHEVDAVRARAREACVPIVLALESWQAPLAHERLGLTEQDHTA